MRQIKTLQRIDRILMKITKVMAYIAAAFLFAVMLVAFIDALLGKLFSLNIPHANEFIANAGVPIVFFGVAYVQMQGRHTKIEILTDKFPKGVVKVLSLIMNIMALFFCSFMLWRGLVYSEQTFSTGVLSGTINGFKVWPFPVMMSIGWGIWAVAYLWTIICDLVGLERYHDEDEDEDPLN